MSKREKILITLASLSAIVLVYILIASKRYNQPNQIEKIVIPEKNIEKESKIDLNVLNENYKTAFRSKFKTIDNELSSSHLAPIASSSLTKLEDPIYLESERVKTKIANLKNEVMAMTVPAEWRDLHVKIVFALDKYDSYISDGNPSERVASLDLLRTAKNKYTWLLD